MKTSKRKPNSIFDEQVNSINSFGIGTIYKVKDMRNRMSVGKHNTDRVGDYHLDLLSTKCIKRVKRGYYEVVGIIPSFLTLNMCEANRGYTTYGPNPKYLGKTDKYGQNGCYDEWYVNNEKPQIQVQRGKKWKLGEPNPFAVEIIEEPKKEEVKPEPETERKINLVKSFFTTENPGKCLTAINGNVLVIIISLNKSGTHALVKYPKIGASDSFLVAISELKHIVVSFESVPEYTNKKAQIVNILKQGLSASDAADLILKLK